MQKCDFHRIYYELSKCGIEGFSAKLALIPIWPNYASLLYDRTKKYEYRKVKPRQDDYIYLVYETRPISMITGFFMKEQILEETPASIWDKTKTCSGIEPSMFFSYFSNRKIAYAIEIKKSRKFFGFISLKELGLPTPQTLRYL